MIKSNTLFIFTFLFIFAFVAGCKQKQPNLFEVLKSGDSATINKRITAENIHTRNKFGDNLLVFASRLPKAKLKTLKHLIKLGIDINERGALGDTALVAMMKKYFVDLELAEFLLKNGADPNLKNSKGDTALLLSIVEKRRPQRIDVLLYHHANPFLFNNDGVNAITAARNIQNDDLVKKIKILVQKNRHLYKDVELESDWSPFIIACQNGDLKKVRSLIEANVDINQKDNFGQTGLMRAIMAENSSIVDLLLSNKKVNLDAVDKRGNTALHLASINNNIESFKKLIDAGANLNVKDNKGYMPIHIVAAGRDLEKLKLLLERKIDINGKNKLGRTPLAWAIHCRCSIEVVKLMVRAGADTRDKSVLAEAVLRKDKEITVLLGIISAKVTKGTSTVENLDPSTELLDTTGAQ